MFPKSTNTEPAVSRKYKIGQEVIGRRAPNYFTGTLVRCYVTLNNGYRNMAYVVKCHEDGKERSFQMLSDNS
jgi:hypothetical protein